MNLLLLLLSDHFYDMLTCSYGPACVIDWKGKELDGQSCIDNTRHAVSSFSVFIWIVECD